MANGSGSSSEPSASAAERPVLGLAMTLAALNAFAPFATDMYLASLPQLASSFVTDAGRVQLTLSVFFLGLALGQLVYGPLIDHFGRKRPLLIGIAIFVAASLLLIVAPSIEVFIGLRLLQAMGGCAGMVVGRAVIADLFKEREAARVLSLMMLVQGLAPVAAPVVGGYVAVIGGWQAIFAFLAVFGVGCFLAAGLGLPETLPHAARQRAVPANVLRTFLGLLANSGYIVPALAGGFAFSCLFAFISGSPFVYIQLHGVSEQHYGWFFALNAAGMIIAAQVNRRLLRRFPPRTVLRGGLAVNLLGGILLLLFGAEAPFPLLVALLWLTLATIPLIGANAIAIAMNVGRAHGGSASALIGVSQFVLASITSALVGLMQNGTAWPMIIMIFVGGLLANLVIWLGPRPVPAPARP